MLEVRSVSVRFSQEVLRDVSFSVAAGQIVGIVGPSGGGKSSLLKIAAGLLDADTGTVHWNGNRVKGPKDVLVPGHADIQLVNQDFGLDLYHTVEQNVIQKMLYLPQEPRQRFATELLELVELDALSTHQAIHLSGGEQQRLAIARALAAEPDVLLLDEPFAHLDAHLKARIGWYVRQLCETRGMTCILVSHEGQDVLQWCSEIHFIREGSVQRTASPETFYFQPVSRYEALFFGEINEVQLNNNAPLLFRPNECVLTTDATGIPVTLVHSLFAGPYWRTVVSTENDERIVIFTNEFVQDARGIHIRKKNP